MARDPVAVFWIPENRDPMINDMMTTWISLQDYEVISQSGPQLLCVLPLPQTYGADVACLSGGH